MSAILLFAESELDMDFTEGYGNLISSDKIRFQHICRKLLKSTFIVKEKNAEQRSDYFFITRADNIGLFSEYFGIMGYDVIADTTVGVAMLINRTDDKSAGVCANRVKLKLYESVVLCCLWLIYDNKITSGGLGAVIIRKSDLDMEIERLGYSEKLDKNKMQDTLKLLESYNLIEVNGQITDYECNIRLLPSLRFCISGNEFKTFVDTVIPKFKRKKEDSEFGDDMEETEFSDDKEEQDEE